MVLVDESKPLPLASEPTETIAGLLVQPLVFAALHVATLMTATVPLSPLT
jgi:hypothetical protein